MTVFKVGDRVRPKEDHRYLSVDFVAGKQGTVGWVSEAGVRVDVGARRITFNPEELELVKESPLVARGNLPDLRSTIFEEAADGTANRGFDVEVTQRGDQGECAITANYSRFDSGWQSSVRGKRAAKLTDDGNGVVIRLEGMRIKLDYSQFSILQLLVQCWLGQQPADSLNDLIELREASNEDAC